MDGWMKREGEKAQKNSHMNLLLSPKSYTHFFYSASYTWKDIVTTYSIKSPVYCACREPREEINEWNRKMSIILMIKLLYTYVLLLLCLPFNEKVIQQLKCLENEYNTIKCTTRYSWSDKFDAKTIFFAWELRNVFLSF